MGTRTEVNEIALRRFLRDPDGPVGDTITDRTILAHGLARRLLKLPGQGRVYRLYGPRRIHRASAPGQPPATDQNTLGPTVAKEVRVDEEGIVGRVGTRLKVGRYLEKGTERLNAEGDLEEHIKARPWLRPALAATGGRIVGGGG